MLDSGMQFTISTVYKNIRDEKIVLWYTATVVLWKVYFESRVEAEEKETGRPEDVWR